MFRDVYLMYERGPLAESSAVLQQAIHFTTSALSCIYTRPETELNGADASNRDIDDAQSST